MSFRTVPRDFDKAMFANTISIDKNVIKKYVPFFHQIWLLLELVDEMAGKCFSPILSSRKVHLAFVAFELIFCYTLIVSLCLPGG